MVIGPYPIELAGLVSQMLDAGLPIEKILEPIEVDERRNLLARAPRCLDSRGAPPEFLERSTADSGGNSWFNEGMESLTERVANLEQFAANAAREGQRRVLLLQSV
jgi:hypothetical protein